MTANGSEPFVASYPIASAAALAGMHPQTLRQYDRLGLVVPERTQGGSRRYSAWHIQKLQEISRLSAEGVGLSAIIRILELEEQISRLEAELFEARQGNPAPRLASSARVFAAASSGSVVALKPGSRAPRQVELMLWDPRFR